VSVASRDSTPTGRSAARKAKSRHDEARGDAASKRSRRRRGPAPPPADAGAAVPASGAVFAALRNLLAKYAGGLRVAADGPTGYSLESPKPWRGKPLFVAGVRYGKSYVSYYLMPVYGCPDLLDGVSPELRARMHGKSCFNFRRIEPALFGELGTLTRAGFERFRRNGLI
jgi:hypothetical protein